MNQQTTTTFPDRPHRVPAATGRRRRAFTLIELMVVVSLIVLLLATALPTINRLFNAGADAQAYNMLAAQLATARAIALQRGTYTCVHIQPGDATERLREQRSVYMAILQLDPNSLHFSLPADFNPPEPVGGHIAFGDVGRLDSYYNDDDDVNDAGQFTNLQGLDADEFTTIDFVFSPAGKVVRRVPGAPDEGGVRIADNCPTVDSDRPVWERRDARAGATAVILFDYNWFSALDLDDADDGNDAALVFNESASFLPVNLYTGELFPRE